MKKIQPPKSFIEKYEVKETGCWEWIAARTGGYGKYWNPFRKSGDWAHRFAYELLVGEIPEGLQLDHLCRNRACVNPAHLEPVTRTENLSRVPTVNSTKCRNGHNYNEYNTYIRPNGRKDCRACQVASFNRYSLKKKQLGTK